MRETIRLATVGDVAAVTALTKAAYAKWVPVIGREPVPMQADYDAAISDHRIDLLFVGPEMVALPARRRRTDRECRGGAAIPEARLWAKDGRPAEQLAAQAGVGCVRLYTNSRFETNLRLYASLGYEIEREESFRGGVAIHMLKRLALYGL